MSELTSRRTHLRADATPANSTIDWAKGGLAMALTFSLLQMLNEIGTMMAIPLYSSMAAELQLSAGQATWALMSTTIFGAATIALLAKAGDLYGHRRWMVISVLGIIAGFIISALAPNLVVLIIGRALTGTMAGQALCVGIMNDRLTGPDRHKAIAIIAGGQAVGVFCGFALGGVIVDAGGTWRTAFWCGALLTAISLGAFLAFGKDSLAIQRHQAARPRIEPWGVLLLGIGLTALCIGISQSTAWGLTSLATVACVIGGIALIVTSFLVESRSQHPLIDVSELVGRNLTPAYAVFAALGVCGMLLFNLGLTLLQVPGGLFGLGYGFGLSALQASFVFIPMTVAGIVATKVIPAFVARTSARIALMSGGVLLAAAFLIIRLDYTNLAMLLVAILVYGFGYTTLLSTALAVIAAEAKEGKAAGTASLYVAIALAASSLGAAIFAALQGNHMAPVSGPDGAPVVGPDGTAVVLPTAGLFDTGFTIAIVASLVAVVAGLLLRPSLRVEVDPTAH